MMCGLLMLFILVMCICLFQAKTNYDIVLEEQKASSIAQKEYTDALIKQRDELLSKQATIESQNEFISSLQSQLDEKNISLDELGKALELVSSQGQGKIEQILGVKAELIKELTDELSKNGADVEIDSETGAMKLSTNVVFGYNEDILTEEGKKVLGEVLPIYCKVLLNKKYSNNIAEIVVDGYTDTSGTYEYNLALSQKRSLAVANYLLSISGDFLEDSDVELLKSKLTVNGHSMNNPILDEKGNIDEEASRRVEVKFRLKDEEIIKEISDTILSVGDSTDLGNVKEVQNPETSMDELTVTREESTNVNKSN